MSLEWLIENLSVIISCFVPGYIFLFIFCFFVGKKIKTMENLFVCSVSLSYVFELIAQAICKSIKTDINNSVYLSLLLSIIASIICVKYYLSDLHKTISLKLGNISGKSNIWEELIDRKRGANIRGYVKFRNQDAEIKGTVKYYEVLENGDCNLALLNYTITNENFNYSPKENSDLLFYIKSSDIEGIEILRGK